MKRILIARGRHPYIRFLYKKYKLLKKVNEKNIDLLEGHRDYLESINSLEIEIDIIETKINNLNNINYEYNELYIWPYEYDEGENRFNIIDKEELCKEAFKPSRVFYQMSLDPEYLNN